MEYFNEDQKITKEEFNSFIEKVNLNLPDSYKEHILKVNGGAPNLSCFYTEKGYEAAVSYFYSIKYGENYLEEVIIDIGDVLPEHFFPFAYGVCGSQFCIDLSESSYGKVYIWFHDMGDEEGEDRKYLAPSFKDFMAGLQEDPDGIV